MTFWSAIATLPDLDFVLPDARTPDVSILDHRGVTHSVTFAIGIGLIFALTAHLRGRSALRWGLAGALVVASHGLLDLFGESTLGVQSLWPVSHDRFLVPWRILPNPPVGPELLTASGLTILALEAAIFLPLWVYAISRPKRPNGPSPEIRAESPRERQ